MGLVTDSAVRPLIVTLRLDAESHRFFTEQRTRFFPFDINYLEAHVTLFHHLPGEAVAQVSTDLRFAVTSRPGFPVEATGLRSLGWGVAYTLESPGLLALRADLLKLWFDWLTPQDRQKFKPHLTIQNKVTAETARETLALLQTGFTRRQIEATGIELWRYDGGPWHPLQSFSFR